MVAVFLREDMLDLAGGVDEPHHQLHVALHSRGEDDRLALLAQVAEEVFQVLALVDVEQTLVVLEPQVEIVFAPGGGEVAFLIGSEGE